MRIGQLLIDVSPLRESRDFRWLYGGRCLSLLGSALSEIAVLWQIYDLTHSSLAVGLGSLLIAVCTVVGLLKGGELADRLDRRRVLISIRVPEALLATALAANSMLGHPLLAVLFVLAGVAGLLSGLGAPSSSASIPMIVGSERVAAAAALNGLSYQLGAIIGPALAGLLIAGPGLTWCYALDALSFVGFAVSVSFLPPMLPGVGSPRRTTFRSIAEGVRFVRENGVLAGVLLTDANAMVFGVPEALFPALATQQFHGGSATFGLLCAGPAIGAVLGAATSGWTGRVRRPGMVVLAASGVWGAAIAVFGLTHQLLLGMVFLGVAGMADLVSEVLRSALLQQHTPDWIRGRVSSLWLAQTNAAPGVGNAEAGALAALTDVTVSVVSGGVLCIAGAALLAVACPALRKSQLNPGLDDSTEARQGSPTTSPARSAS
jgi:MFS transporter, ENTS family, enterobactin (siderophore) exporter